MIQHKAVRYYFNKKTGYYQSNKGVKLHVEIYKSVYGEIPEGNVVHHKDGDKTNNDSTNLILMTASEHNKLHMLGNKIWFGKHHTDESKQKCRDAKLGDKNPRYGVKETPEHAKERGKLISIGKTKPVTQEMIDDAFILSKRKWSIKHGYSSSVWSRIRTTT
jgi:hypothetical protein